jgi:hypothetical protein
MNQGKQKTGKPAKRPEIYKEEDFDLMLKLIDRGIWKNCNLARALHLDEETVAKWKKHPQVIKAHTNSVLKFAGRRTDVENILKELDLEIETQPQTVIDNRSITVINYAGTTKQLPDKREHNTAVPVQP